MLWQETAIARPQLVEPLPSIAAKRLVAGYTLAEQQSFDAIDVLDPLGDQDLALATKSAAVLFLGCWRFCDRLTFGYAHACTTRTAFEAYTERKGVCRDFAHLAVAFCRCMNIP